MNFINIIIKNEYYENEKDLLPLLFDDEDFLLVNDKFDFYEALVLLEIFSSKTQARKNYKKSDGIIPKGYNEFKGIGKNNKELYI